MMNDVRSFRVVMSEMIDGDNNDREIIEIALIEMDGEEIVDYLDVISIEDSVEIVDEDSDEISFEREIDYVDYASLAMAKKYYEMLVKAKLS